MEKPETVWGFVAKYYPNYDQCGTIAYADNLQKIMDKELNGGTKDLWYRKVSEGGFNRNVKAVEREYEAVHREIYEKAIQGYLDQLNK